jgi:hypothetical protein
MASSLPTICPAITLTGDGIFGCYLQQSPPPARNPQPGVQYQPRPGDRYSARTQQSLAVLLQRLALRLKDVSQLVIENFFGFGSIGLVRLHATQYDCARAACSRLRTHVSLRTRGKRWPGAERSGAVRGCHHAGS